MRQRKIKNLNEKIEEFSDYLIKNPEECKGRWNEIFGNDNPIYLEIGCGKGKFISTHAIKNADINYIGIEGQESVILRALEKAKENELQNLKLMSCFVNSLKDFFEEGEISGIYLNFSDPWPKARHDKRRLTYIGRLKDYFEVLRKDSFVAIKTDNEGLFEFTLEQIELGEFKILEITRDLVTSEYEAKNITTEYEDKFSAMGKNINYVKIRA